MLICSCYSIMSCDSVMSPNAKKRLEDLLKVTKKRTFKSLDHHK
jgi:hypothetical protein